MNNIKIANELVKLSKSLISYDPQEEKDIDTFEEELRELKVEDLPKIEDIIKQWEKFSHELSHTTIPLVLVEQTTINDENSDLNFLKPFPRQKEKGEKVLKELHAKLLDTWKLMNNYTSILKGCKNE